MKHIFEKLLEEVAWDQRSPQIIGAIRIQHARVPNPRLSQTYREVRDALKLEEETAPPPPPPTPPRLDKLELDTGYITFDNGVPVGGYSHLSLFPNGAFSFTGHFHDSGAPSYDTSLVWVLKSAAGSAFAFKHGGRVHGTFESGSRNDDWGDSGTNAALAATWADISAGYTWAWQAGRGSRLRSTLR
jgi:hypothetical protein